MIGGGALWLLLHVVAAILIALHLWYRRHHDSYWHEPEKALWVGGLCADFADAELQSAKLGDTRGTAKNLRR